MFVESHTPRSLLCCSVSLFHLGYCIIHGPPPPPPLLYTHTDLPFPPFAPWPPQKVAMRWWGGGIGNSTPKVDTKWKSTKNLFYTLFMLVKKKKTFISPSHLTAVILPTSLESSSFSDRCFATQSPSLSRSYHFPWIKDGSTRAHACFSTFSTEKTRLRCLFHREGQASTRTSVSLLKMHTSQWLLFLSFFGKLCPPVALIYYRK